MKSSEIDKIESQKVLELLRQYFPDSKFTDKTLTTAQLDMGEILFKPDQVLPYLQTVFFEEHLLEIQCDQSTRVFFTSILDENPETDGDDNATSKKYELGSYLKDTDSFILSPLSPGIGNARIRSCKQVVARFYMGTTAVELGCTFRGQDMLGDIPVLRLDFPEIGRVNRNYRPYRVKAVSGVDAKILILKSKSDETLQQCYQIDDVSTMGLAFQVPTKGQLFEIGEKIRFNVEVTGISDLEIGATIRHSSQVRVPGGYINICGVQFDLESRSLAAKIERLAATIQRLQLRQIAEKIAFIKGVRLIK